MSDSHGSCGFLHLVFSPGEYAAFTQFVEQGLYSSVLIRTDVTYALLFIPPPWAAPVVLLGDDVCRLLHTVLLVLS
jgi:hypothetical protein